MYEVINSFYCVDITVSSTIGKNVVRENCVVNEEDYSEFVNRRCEMVGEEKGLKFISASKYEMKTYSKIFLTMFFYLNFIRFSTNG